MLLLVEEIYFLTLNDKQVLLSMTECKELITFSIIVFYTDNNFFTAWKTRSYCHKEY